MGEAFHLIVGDGEKYAAAFVNIHTAKSVRIPSSFLITCRSDTKLYRVKLFFSIMHCNFFSTNVSRKSK